FIVDLTGEVHERRAGRLRFTHRARSIARARAGARHDDAEAAAGARIAVGHVRRAGFSASRDEAHRSSTSDRVEHGHVMNADDAEEMADACGLQQPSSELADRDTLRGTVAIHGSGFCSKEGAHLPNHNDLEYEWF